MRFFEKQMEKEKIRVVKEFGKDNPTFEGVYSQIEEVILNLVMNAWQAMDGGGVLSIKTRSALLESGNFVMVEIRDTGTGIGTENMTKIFDPFFTTKDKKKGTGLGLYVTQNIIKQHCGHIIVKSKEGEGTEVVVTLPETLPRQSG